MKTLFTHTRTYRTHIWTFLPQIYKYNNEFLEGRIYKIIKCIIKSIVARFNCYNRDYAFIW
jgi:hypothetical protein